MTTILGQGVYSIREAALLTKLPSRRLREWFSNRKTDHDSPPAGRTVNFLELVEAVVAVHLREHGVPLPALREIHARLSKEYHTEHPFAHAKLRADGSAASVRSHNRDRASADPITGHKMFPKLILPFLQQISYHPTTGEAARWHIADGVMVDPGKSFGKPVLARNSIPTYIIAAEYQANHRNAERVAGWYDLTADEVMAAVRFEGSLAA